MSDKKNLTPQPPRDTSRAMIDSFLDQTKRVPVVSDATPRLVFALDATMSRQPTWDLACRVQGEMFETASGIGGLAVQLVYFRGFGECRSSGWVVEPRALTNLMTTIDCRGGHTQIGRVLRHVGNEARRSSVRVLVYVGDAMEESVDDLCAVAGELGLMGVKAFMFHEGHDPTAARAFREIARLTGGAYARFDANAPNALRDLLQAAAAYAARGVDGMQQIAGRSEAARGLLASMKGRSR
jgi:hypothetical protein